MVNLSSEDETFSSDRLCFRRPKQSDQDFFIELYGNPHVMKNIPPHGKPEGRDKALKRLMALIEHWEMHGYGMFLLTWKDSGQPAGYCGLRYMPETGDIELGYIIDQQFWGRGVATEAAERCIMFSEKTLKAPRIIAVTSPDNAQSGHILGRLGFSRVPELDGVYHGMHHLFFKKDAAP